MVEVEETGEGEIELGGGTYYANATFDNPNYNSIIENATFTVYPTSKYEMMVNVTEDIIYGENATLNVTINATLPGVIDGFVNVTVGGMNFSAPVNQGYATLNITGLKPGKYVFDVTYSGNANYTNKSVNAEINVQKVLIDAADAKYGLENSYEYIAKIVSENGTALANKTVTFTINGKTYNATTDENGNAKVTLTSLKVGSYDIVIYNDLAGNATRKITVLERLTRNVNLVMDYVDGSSFNVKAIGNDGNPISGAVVKMSVNGVTYNIKTDKNGVAKLPIRLKPGKYAITCSYKGTTVKNTIKVKYTLKAQKKISVKKTSKKLILKATLKWSNGKAIVGKTLKFKFKGKTYKVKTNKNGVAKVIIKKKVIKKLKRGKTYKARISYKNETVKTKVKVKK